MKYSTIEQKNALHTQLIKWLSDCERSESEMDWQERAREDYKFYAGDQDTAEVKALLEQQNRGCPVFNEIKPKVDMLVGMGSQLEGGLIIIPVGVEDAPLAELLGYAHDHFRKLARATKREGECFEHAVKSGHSWLHVWVSQEGKRPVIKVARIPGRFCHCDPDAVETDKSDARFFFRDKWLPAEAIEARWPSFKFVRDEAGFVIGGEGTFTQAHQTNDYLPTFFNEANDKHRVVECWWKAYENEYTFLNPITNQPESMLEDQFKQFRTALKKGIQVKDALIQKDNLPATMTPIKVLWTAMITGSEILEMHRSIYRHKMIPYAYLEAYHQEELNNSLSVIDAMKDPQRALNTTRRQLIHLLQTLPKGILVHEAGAILNIEDYEQRSSEPGFHLEVAPGALNKYKFEQAPQISQVFGQLDSLFQQSMKDSSGIQDALLGIQTSTREPGITAQMRGEASAAVLFTLFENYKEFKYNVAVMMLENIRQFIQTPHMLRIEGPKGQELLEANTQLNPQLDGWNDLSAGEFDYIIDEDAVTKSMKKVIAQMLTELNTNNPGTVPGSIIAEYINMPYSARVRIQEHEQQQLALQQQANEIEQGKAEEELAIKRFEAETKREELNHKIEAGFFEPKRQF